MDDHKDNMFNEADWLSSYKRSVASQCGEDGVIEKIFEIMKEENRWCVEFGGWDGRSLSNTWNLLVNKHWSGLIIEADADKYRQMLQTYQDNGRVICLNKLVGFDGKNTLDNILSQTNIPRDFDLLAIDIDGNDYHVWDSANVYAPRLIVIEFNPTIPMDIEFIQPRDMNINQGSSLLSLYKLGKRKGYELVAALDFNAFFVKNEYFDLFKIRDNNPSSVRKERGYGTRLFQLFDGTLVLSGCNRLLWHNVEIKDNKIQILPGYLRRYPGKLSPLQRILLRYRMRGIFVRLFAIIKSIGRLLLGQRIYEKIKQRLKTKAMDNV